jgi:hypothetical protein
LAYGTTEPQVRQNARSKTGDDLYRSMASSPDNQENPSRETDV